jgi:hypothetical protein
VTHDELRALVPIYALNALAAEEEGEVSAHLAACGPCQETFDAFQRVAGGVALVAPPVAPPAALRERLLRQAAHTRQDPAPSGTAAGIVPGGARPALAAGGGPTLKGDLGPPGDGVNAPRRAGGAPGAGPAAPGPAGAVTPFLERARHRHRARWQQVAAIVAAAAVVALGGLSYALAHRLHSSNQEIARQRQFIAALGAPVLTTVPMVAVGSDTKAGGQLYVAASGHSAGLVLTGLANPGGDVYQLWLIVNNVPSPVVAFRPDPAGEALVPVNADLSQMQAMAVTLEKKAGLRAPQGPKVLQSA